VPGRCWLFKSDPATFGWDDLRGSPRRTTRWDGVRNYQARNLLRDDVEVGDGVLFYHSQSDKAVMGTAKVVRAGYPDPTDPESGDAPRWYAVDIRLDREFVRPVSLAEMRETAGLEDLALLKRGSRLSIQPVTRDQWKIVTRLGTRR